MSGKAFGSSDSLVDLTTEMAYVGVDSSTDTATHNMFLDNIFTARIPMDAANKMDLRLSYSNPSSGSCRILITGFGI